MMRIGLNFGTLVGAIFPKLAERIRRRREAPPTPLVPAAPAAEVQDEPISAQLSAQPDDAPDALFVTGAANRYHRRGCKSIEGRDLTPITRAQIDQGDVTPCRMCRP